MKIAARRRKKDKFFKKKRFGYLQKWLNTITLARINRAKYETKK